MKSGRTCMDNFNHLIKFEVEIRGLQQPEPAEQDKNMVHY